MTPDRRPHVTLHVATSLDGFIARRDNTVSWLESPEDAYPAGVALDSAMIEETLARIDCYVLGSRTYEHALELGWPYGDTPVIVLTHRELSSERESVELYSGDLRKLLDEKLASRFRNIWLAGGAELCQSFLRLELVDRIVLSIAPVTLGGGLRLFDASGPEQLWQLKDVVAFNTGFVELTYERVGTSA